MSFKAPMFKGSAFNCPHCSAYSHMSWHGLFFQQRSAGWNSSKTLIALCGHCGAHSYWLSDEPDGNIPATNGKMIFPLSHTAPLPHAEMPSDVQKDYEEARDIAQHSPRAAAALLRLCVQKLCKLLGEPGKNINEDIGSLVKKGLPIELQQALDIVRVVGNNAVHPGALDSSDVATVSSSLFDLVNYIVDDRIARPKKLASMFSALPEPALSGIAARDKNS